MPYMIAIELDPVLMTNGGGDSFTSTGQFWLDLDEIQTLNVQRRDGVPFMTAIHFKNATIGELGQNGSKSFWDKWERYCESKDTIASPFPVERDEPAELDASKVIAIPTGGFNPNGGRISKF